MYYLTDNPYPAIVVLAGLAICAFVAGNSSLRKLGVILAILAGLVYFVEDMIVSPREEVEIVANEVLKAFQQEDLTAVSSHISRQSPDLNDIARRGLELVRLENSFHVKSVELVSETSDEIVTRIRANGRITVRSQSVTQHVPEFWETTWIRESDSWKLSKAVLEEHSTAGNPAQLCSSHRQPHPSHRQPDTNEKQHPFPVSVFPTWTRPSRDSLAGLFSAHNAGSSPPAGL